MKISITQQTQFKLFLLAKEVTQIRKNVDELYLIESKTDGVLISSYQPEFYSRLKKRLKVFELRIKPNIEKLQNVAIEGWVLTEDFKVKKTVITLDEESGLKLIEAMEVEKQYLLCRRRMVKEALNKACAQINSGETHKIARAGK